MITFEREALLAFILQPDRITSAQAGHVIKISLTRMCQEGRCLGGFQHTVDE